METITFKRPKGKDREVVDVIPHSCSGCGIFAYLVILACGHEAVRLDKPGEFATCRECE